MNRVYLLGAGASRELKMRFHTINGGYGTSKTNKLTISGPLSSGYFYYADALIKEIQCNVSIGPPSIKIYDSLFQAIQEYYKNNYSEEITQDNLLTNEQISKRINIENLYIYIETEIDKIKEEDRQINVNNRWCKLYHAAKELRGYIYNTLSLMCYYCDSEYHLCLAYYITRTGGNIISFNWDVLLDQAMIKTGKWSYETGYGFKFAQIKYIEDGTSKKPNASQGSTNNLILKPHGSINWYFNEDAKRTALVIQPDMKERAGSWQRLRDYENFNGHFSPYIIPPGKKRKYFPEIWNQISQILEQTDEIIAIGFSFNQNDQYITNEFSDIKFRKGLRIILVNPEGDILIKTYQKVFKTDRVEWTYNSFAGYCTCLTQQVGMEDMQPLIAP